MREALFDGIQEIPNDIVIKKMKYFIKEANVGIELFETDKKGSLLLAKRLRKELEQEYKNNDLKRIRNFYKDHKLFSAFYSPAIQNAFVKTTGPLSYDKLFGFLYDIESYMNHFIPSEYE